mgnify:CR=1 FL=1
MGDFDLFCAVWQERSASGAVKELEPELRLELELELRLELELEHCWGLLGYTAGDCWGAETPLGC